MVWSETGYFSVSCHSSLLPLITFQQRLGV